MPAIDRHQTIRFASSGGYHAFLAGKKLTSTGISCRSTAPSPCSSRRREPSLSLTISASSFSAGERELFADRRYWSERFVHCVPVLCNQEIPPQAQLSSTSKNSLIPDSIAPPGTSRSCSRPAARTTEASARGRCPGLHNGLTSGEPHMEEMPKAQWLTSLEISRS